jgi:23S rRNA-/tRNA-specific pseudouridylate synthase
MSAPIKLSSPATKEFWEIPVLFEDANLLALDKPAGLLTSPDRCNLQRPSLMKLLHAGIENGKPWARERNLDYLANAHRLDLETSGIILLAKDKPALIALANLFGSEKPLKSYTALAWGNPPAKHFEVDAGLAPHPLKPGQMHVDKREGMKAKTQFEVLEQFSDWCLLRYTAHRAHAPDPDSFEACGISDCRRRALRREKIMALAPEKRLSPQGRPRGTPADLACRAARGGIAINSPSDK